MSRRLVLDAFCIRARIFPQDAGFEEPSECSPTPYTPLDDTRPSEIGEGDAPRVELHFVQPQQPYGPPPNLNDHHALHCTSVEGPLLLTVGPQSELATIRASIILACIGNVLKSV
jgi:hypothetical protein